jgi:hypothetical protein
VSTRQYTRLADPQFLPNAVASVYANPAATTSYIKSILIFNSGVGTQNVKLYNVPDDATALGTAAAVNQFLDVDIIAKETFMLDLPYPMTLIDQNDSIQGVATDPSTVTIQLLGDIAQ